MINRRRRFFRYGLLISLWGVLSYAWLMTERGLRVTLQLIEISQAGAWKIGGVQGYLAGPIRIQHIDYSSPSYHFSINNLTFTLRKKALLQKKLQIQHVKIETLEFISHASESDFSSVPSFPTIQIEQVDITKGILKNKDYELDITGQLGEQGVLNWKLIGKEVSGRGEIRVPQDPNAWICVLLKEMRTSHHVWPKMLQIRLDRADRQWLLTVDKIGIATPLRYMEVKLNQVYASIWSKKLKECWSFQAKIERLAILQHLPFTLFEQIDYENSGPIKIKGEWQGSLKDLTYYINCPVQDQRKPFSLQASTVHADLSLHWYQPKLGGGNIFEAFSMQAAFRKHQIVWTSSLKGLKGSGGAWKLRGESQWIWSNTPVKKTRNVWNQLGVKGEFRLTGSPISLFQGGNYPLALALNTDIKVHDRNIIVGGELCIPKARWQLTVPATRVAPDSDICFARHDNHSKDSQWFLDMQLKLKLGQSVYLYYSGLTTRLTGSVTLEKKHKAPLATTGEIKMVEGQYYYFGQLLHVDANSRLIFLNSLFNPRLDIKAKKEISIKPTNTRFLPFLLPHLKPSATVVPYAVSAMALPIPVTVGVHLKGELDSPTIHLFSDSCDWIRTPEDHLSYLVTGQPCHALNQSTLALLMNMTSELSKGYRSYHDAYSYFHRKLGLNVGIESETIANNTHLFISKRLLPTTEIAIQGGLMQPSLCGSLRYQLGKNLLAGVTTNVFNGRTELEMLYQVEW